MTVPFQCASSIVTGAGGTRNYPVTVATGGGDTLCAVVVANNLTCTISGLTDSQGNLYTLDQSFTSAVPAVYAFRSPGATGGSSGGPTAALAVTDTFIVTTAAVSGNIELMATDVPGAGAVDQIAAIASGTSTTPSVSATPTAAGETCISYFASQNAGGSPTVNSPFTSVGTPLSSGSNPFTAMAYDVLAGGSGVAQTSTETITSAGWRAGMWTFQAGAAGVTGTGGLALGALAFAGSGTVPAVGSGGLALGALAFAGSGVQPVTGTGGLALAPLAFAGAGTDTRQLVMSLAPAAGTDPFGNGFPAGITLFGLPVQTESGGVMTTQITPSGDFAAFNSHGKVIAQLAAANGGGSGLFVYADAGASQGTLIASVASAAGTDLITGAAYPRGVSVGATGGQQVQQILTGLAAFLAFPSGAAFENTPAQIGAAIGGTSPAQFISMVLSSASDLLAGARDQVKISFNSANADGSSNANLDFIYEGSNGVLHELAFMDSTGFNVLAGSIVGVDPGSLPATPATWHTISLQNSYTAGTNNGFVDVPQIRMMADNRNLQFKGSLTVPATPSSIVWGLLPASFPNASMGGPFGLGLVANYAGGVSDHIQVQNNSNLSLNNAAAHGGDTFNISCMVPTQ